MKRLLIILFLSVFAGTFSVAQAEQVKIIGAYQDKLDVYLYSEPNNSPVKQAFQLTESDVNGSHVLAKDSRSLIKINLNGKELWLRSGQLKLSQNIDAVCPDSAPGKQSKVAPVASGMGAGCRKPGE